MLDQPTRNSATLGISIILGLSLLGYLLADAILSVKSMERTVVVKGLSEREVPANLATWPIAFQVANNNLNEIFSQVESNNKIIKKFLTENGISKEEISLAPPIVVDLHAQQWGDKQYIQFRYTASSVVTVYSENVTAVQKAMSKVVILGKQGIVIGREQNSNRRNQFFYTKLSSIKPEMVEEATKNARAVAEKFALDSNSKLGKIKSARQGQFSISNRDSTTPYIKKVRVVSTVEYYLAD